MTGKKRTFLIVLLLIIFIFLNLAFLFYMIEEIVWYDMKLKVGDHIGLNSDVDKVNFGTILPHGSSSKYLIINNDYKNDVSVNLYFFGELKNYVEVKEKRFLLPKNETKEIEIKVYDPEKGKSEYKGKILILILRT